jgi:glycine cleavage system H lipoate-binding protein
MKEYSGGLWTETAPSGVVRLGFSKVFIEQKLGECFHVMQADSKNVKEGEPLLVLETNDGLESLKSPITGTILHFNSKARNFPDRLTEEDNILEVLPEGVKAPKPDKKEKIITDWISQATISDDMFRTIGQITNRGTS